MTSQSSTNTPAINMANSLATLVFPATHPDGRNYFEAAQMRHENVVAATSERSSELFDEITDLAYLPYVYEDTFPDFFLNFISTKNIGRIYAPVAAVHSWLNRFIVENKLSIQLIGESPIKREMERFNKLIQKVASYRSFILDCSNGRTNLSNIEIASVFRMIGNIYGESNDQKIAAMMAIFASAPKGDVIEIGSLVGKSASVLALMSKRFKIGNVLAIDPWHQGAATQHDSPDNVKIHMVKEWDYEILPQNFSINILPIGLGHFNYLRMESEKGWKSYSENLTVTNEVFGTINYTGTISVIHIDGNHDFEKVDLDCKLWLPLLDKQGWLILDDYIWAHGDGPYRVGNTLLETHASKIELSFVCGKALFVKFREEGS